MSPLLAQQDQLTDWADKISPSYSGAAKMSGDHQTGLAEAPPLIFIMIVRA
jgi:hypothetical protein